MSFLDLRYWREAEATQIGSGVQSLNRGREQVTLSVVSHNNIKFHGFTEDLFSLIDDLFETT